MKGWLIPTSGMAYSVDYDPNNFISECKKFLGCRSVDFLTLERTKDGDIDLFFNDEFELDGSKDNTQLKKSHDLNLLNSLVKGPALIVKYDPDENLVGCTAYDMHRISKIYAISYKGR